MGAMKRGQGTCGMFQSFQLMYHACTAFIVPCTLCRSFGKPSGLQASPTLLKGKKKKFAANKEGGEAGPIAKQSNSLVRGRGNPSSNPGEGCYGDGEQNIHHIACVYS